MSRTRIGANGQPYTVLEPGTTCNAWNGKRKKHCGAPAGRGTDHPRIGRCWHHAGRPVIHGRRSKLYWGRPGYAQPPRVRKDKKRLKRISGLSLWFKGAIYKYIAEHPDMPAWEVDAALEMTSRSYRNIMRWGRRFGSLKD